MNLAPGGGAHWLDLDADTADVLKPCPSERLAAYAVDERVGNVRNNDASLIEPLPA
ncbi:MAG: SOS response-associated peptidase [Alphaproteobacteria bacterium]|nr:SOS response-associated peptidase [Alphaproteobacteria bacterium]